MRLDHGLALPPELAADCVHDERRTAAFVHGAGAAIGEALSRFDAVEVLYAGTGPLAPLVLPFLGMERVRFTLLDVHAESVAAVAARAGALARVVHADATEYRHDAPLHVVISETMQRSLADEPYVAIMRNLRPQLAAGALLVPECVTVDVAILDAATEQARWRGESVPFAPHVLGRAFAIDAAGESAPALVRVPALDPSQWLALVTRIVVHGDETLEPYDSGLTVPEILWNAPTGDLEFRYETGPHPRLVHSPPASRHSR